jgi:hypothetical protein
MLVSTVLIVAPCVAESERLLAPTRPGDVAAMKQLEALFSDTTRTDTSSERALPIGIYTAEIGPGEALLTKASEDQARTDGVLAKAAREKKAREKGAGLIVRAASTIPGTTEAFVDDDTDNSINSSYKYTVTLGPSL